MRNRDGAAAITTSERLIGKIRRKNLGARKEAVMLKILAKIKKKQRMHITA